jgi:diguanylate cyclase (GGDEF)-like protein
LAVVLTRTTSQAAEQEAIASAVLQARTVNEAGIEPYTGDNSLSTTLTPVFRSNLEAVTSGLVETGTVLVLRLRGTDGRIMFDAINPTAAPGAPDPSGDIKDALAGDTVAGRTRFGSDSVDGKRSDGESSIEVYLPIMSRSAGQRVVGVLEMYIPYNPIAASNGSSNRRTYLVLLGGLLALWLVVAVILWSVTRRIHRQSDVNRHLALHDPLTGLPNRALFADRVAQAIGTHTRTGLSVSVAIVDLDRFKEVNDTLGHANGDRLLNCVAERMLQELRPGDTAARLGGDEFGLVLQGVGGEEARSILDRIQQVIGVELELDGVPVTPDASIGWSEWPEHGDGVDSLLHNADLALYAAKDASLGVVRYDVELQPADVSRLGLVAELRQALARGSFELHYQPKVDVSSGRLIGFEALVRWRHAERGLLPPCEFVPVLETTALIGPLTRWVFDTAVGQLAAWGDAASGLTMAVNVSVRNLRDPTMTAWFVQRLASHNIDPSRVIVELTETAIATDPRRVIEHIADLESVGIRISLDDFGQGYTSLSQLSTLRVSELKIDREFIASIQASLKDNAIVASVIELGHRLGLNVVAEGVETAEALEVLRRLGCDVAQGYLFSKPLAAIDARAFLDKARPHDELVGSIS